MLLSPLALSIALAQSSTAPELTIYNGGFGFVKEIRTLNLRQGLQEVAIEDVAASIEANSVVFRSLTDPNSFAVLEQNYQFDLINTMAILNKAVGSVIKLHRTLPNGGKEILEGISDELAHRHGEHRRRRPDDLERNGPEDGLMVASS